MSDVSDSPASESSPSVLARSSGTAQSSERAGTDSALLRMTKADSVRKGVQAALGALESSGLAKVDRRSGEVKVRKLGLAKAALRPAKTIRKAINSATADLVKDPES